MNTRDQLLPDLYQSADQSSRNAQSWFFRTAIAEVLLLTVPPVVSMSAMNHTQKGAAYALALLMLVLTTSAGHFLKFGQKWYRSRALAESIKTTSWRYMMRAQPFSDSDDVRVPRTAFRSFLSEILAQNRELGARIRPSERTGGQITTPMNEVRSKEWNERLNFYVSERIDDQKRWYSAKATWNAQKHKIWFGLSISIYLAMFWLISAGFFQIAGQWETISILSILGAGSLGWARSKKFGELASSYGLTAQEISLIHEKSDDIQSEDELSEFVNEAERAFSREHTQWTARREL